MHVNLWMRYDDTSFSSGPLTQVFSHPLYPAATFFKSPLLPSRVIALQNDTSLSLTTFVTPLHQVRLRLNKRRKYFNTRSNHKYIITNSSRFVNLEKISLPFKRQGWENVKMWSTFHLMMSPARAALLLRSPHLKRAVPC